MDKNTQQHKLVSHEGGIDFRRYFRLIKRKKWVILAIFSVVFVVWMGLAIKLGPRPIYTTDALLQFEDRRALSAMEARGRQQNEGKIGLLMSRNFLGRVIDKLSLAFSVQNVNRISFIDSISLKDHYLEGQYVLKKDGNQIQLFYTNNDKTIEDKKVLDMPYPKNRVIEYGGFKIVIKDSFWNTHKKVSFRVVSREKAIESLRVRLNPKFMNRAYTLLKIEIMGQDRFFIAKILNTVLDEFVVQNLDFKKYHTREVLNILTEQLKTAQVELDKAVNHLKKFREKNPWVGLTQDANGIVNNISMDETQKAQLSNKKAELELLLTRFTNSRGEARYPVLNEILSFLSSQGLSTAPALNSEFLNLNSERKRLLAAYAPTHILVRNNAKKLNALSSKVLLAANTQIQQYENQIASLQKKINSDAYRIRRLPAKELQLAELQRKRTVADQVYSALLVRFNQAKIADAVEVGDIIILDKAVVPPAVGRMKTMLKYALIGLILGLVFGLGTVIIGDLLDKTVRTSDELEKYMSIKVLARIPVIKTEKEIKPEDFSTPSRVDPKLVTADYAPTPTSEAYRNLRTHLLFNNDNVKSIFITSLNPNEGKSLNAGNLAITFAQQKLPTLLIDSDLRRGVLHSSFACKKKPGFSDFLYSNSDITDENIRKVIQQTHIPNLYLLSSGRPIPNPSEMIGSQRTRDIIDFLKKRFGMLVVDTPPIMVTSDCVILSRYVDTGLFVVRAGKSNVERIKEKINEYKDFAPKLAGIVLNFAKLDEKKGKYHYSYYNY